MRAPSPRLLRRCFSIVAVGAWVTVAAAAPSGRREAFGLLAADLLRTRGVQVSGGDLGVLTGLFRSTGSLAASGAHIVAPTVRLGGAASCAGIYADAVVGSAPACATAGAGVPNLFPDLATACEMPAPFPACDASARVALPRGASQSLAAGTYGDVSLSGSASVLDLPGGVYTFCTLRVGRGAQVRVHGPTEIRVAGRVVLSGGLTPAPGVVLSPNDLRVVVAGDYVRLKGSVGARVCAPAAVARLRRLTLQGSVTAGTIKAASTTVMAPYAEAREPCADRNPLRNAYFGDLHVHTTLSFDAYAFDVRTSPDQAYRFAQGDPVQIPPLDINGVGTQTVQLDRPLDFAALTDHSEFLGEVALCLDPASSVYDALTCQRYRLFGNAGTTSIAIATAISPPTRHADICGADGQGCYPRAQLVWDQVRHAAEDAYDRSAACRFTSLVGYEYTASTNVSTLHRNVIFRNDQVPFPTSVFEAFTPHDLWAQLKATCVDGGTGCDVLAIPHNANESNGKMFLPEYPGASGTPSERAQAALRNSIEPLAEIYQHKGDGECSNYLSGITGAPDEQCEFEKRRRPPFADCGTGTGTFGTITQGCVSRRDFLRGAWLEGIAEAERIDANPFRLGVIASTDTHNGTPGYVSEDDFLGHRGTDDGTLANRIGEGSFYPSGYRFSAGGLAGVWAEENSRSALFDALRRRETFGTSGPRIAVRTFGGWNLPAGLCTDPQMLETAYASAVPMGGLLSAPPAGATAPSFLVSALQDAGTPTEPGTALQQVQIIKLWREGGTSHQQVYTVAGDPDNGASVDDTTCVQSGTGFASLCTVWTDPDFDPAQHALYYARVIENPRCRWMTHQCNALAPPDRPPSCSDPTVPRTVQERAWTSPIWFTPAS